MNFRCDIRRHLEALSSVPMTTCVLRVAMELLRILTSGALSGSSCSLSEWASSMRLLVVPASALCLLVAACSAMPSSSPSSTSSGPAPSSSPAVDLPAPTAERLASLAANAQAAAGIDEAAASSLDAALAKMSASTGPASAQPSAAPSVRSSAWNRSGFTVRQAGLTSEDTATSDGSAGSTGSSDAASSATLLTLLASSQDLADNALSSSGEDPIPVEGDSSFDSDETHIAVHREAGGSVGDTSATLSLDAQSPSTTGKVDAAVSLQPCPNPAGEFTFTISNKASLATGKSIAQFSYAVDVRGTVADDATLASLDFDITTTSAQPSAASGYSKVEQTGTLPYGTDGAQWDAAKSTPPRVTAGNAQDPYAQAMSYMAQATALDAIDRVAKSAQNAWRSGRCVALKAEPSPADTEHLKPSQDVAVAVSATSKLDGADIASALTSTLSGPGSLSPSDASTPVQLAFQAASNASSHATAKLRSVSRRGIATASVYFTVASGPLPVEIVDFTKGSDVRVIDGPGSTSKDSEYAGVVPVPQSPVVICDMSKPFALRGSEGVFSFTPSSPTAGSSHLKYSNHGGKATLDATGSYHLTGDLSVPGGEGMLVGDDKGKGRFSPFTWTVTSHRAWPLLVRDAGTPCTQ